MDDDSGRESPPADVAPEFVRQILDLLPLRQVFVCQRVSRNWCYAGRTVVRQRRVFNPVYDEMGVAACDETRCRKSGWCLHSTGSHQRSMLAAAAQLVNLSVIVCDHSRLFFLQFIEAVIQSSAQTLTFMRVHGPSGLAKNYKQKGRLFPSTKKSFPSLKRLVLGYQWDCRWKLDPKLRLPSLQDLTIISEYYRLPHLVSSHAAQLEVLRIPHHQLPQDCHFPRLKVLECKSCIHSSAASLVSVARLTRLWQLVIKPDDALMTAFTFPSQDIMALLRGPSRHVFRKIRIPCSRFQFQEIEEEVRQMQEERREMKSHSGDILSLRAINVCPMRIYIDLQIHSGGIKPLT